MKTSKQLSPQIPSCLPVWFMLVSAVLSSIPAAAADWKAYYGNLHSHSSISDGVESPATAYAWAKTEGKLNFLCLSEHNHMSTQTELTQVKSAAGSATVGSFVGLVGQEYSTLPPNGGNHINVHDVSTPIPQTLNNNYRLLFHDWLPRYTNTNPDAIVVCQFNHPENPSKDYGAAAVGGFPNYAGDWSGFVAEVDPWVSLIAIINGPADNNMSHTATPPRDTHRDTQTRMVQAWHTYLEKGFHLSPVGDQDNHRKSWGTRTTARTGVWIHGALTRESLLMALRDGRCFATEDKNLSVWFDIEQQPMGSILPDPGTQILNATITVHDEDEPTSRYSAELLRDLVGDGNLAGVIARSPVLSNGQSWKTNLIHTAGHHECYLVRVFQTFPSAGDDIWTAPIWIDPALSPEAPHHLAELEIPSEVKFIGSKNSRVYHHPECSVVPSIAAPNRVLYTNAPPSKRLHKDCPLNREE